MISVSRWGCLLRQYQNTDKSVGRYYVNIRLDSPVVNSNEFSISLRQNMIVQRTFILSIFRSRRSWRHSEKWTKRQIKGNWVARFSTLLHRMWFSRRFELLHELGHSLLRRHPCYLIDLGPFQFTLVELRKKKQNGYSHLWISCIHCVIAFSVMTSFSACLTAGSVVFYSV